jgi:hypothetical protein
MNVNGIMYQTKIEVVNKVWLKNSVKSFMWMKVETLIQFCCRAIEVVVFQGRQKIQFLVFLFSVWFVVL